MPEEKKSDSGEKSERTFKAGSVEEALHSVEVVRNRLIKIRETLSGEGQNEGLIRHRIGNAESVLYGLLYDLNDLRPKE